MKITYHLCDNGGVCTEWDVPIKLPVGTKFLHEFGTYIVTEYKDDNTAMCDRL